MNNAYLQNIIVDFDKVEDITNRLVATTTKLKEAFDREDKLFLYLSDGSLWDSESQKKMVEMYDNMKTKYRDVVVSSLEQQYEMVKIACQRYRDNDKTALDFTNTEVFDIKG